MMDYTDRHFRYLLRLIAPQVGLYTDMITTDAILHGDRHRLLDYHPSEHPLALQLGGSDPEKLAACAKIAETYGYDSVNLNAGCPSDRVQHGKFGACLMKEPALVRDCLKAMQESVSIPVTLKTRIGVDEQDTAADLTRFMAVVSTSGCGTIILHARKAWLQGLSPKENRTIPPLCYERVYRLKKEFPQLHIILNGGLQTVAQINTALAYVDGVMIGRYACQNPYFLAQLDAGRTDIPTREAIVAQMLPYIQQQLDQGIRLTAMSRHLLGLFFGTPHARQWRRYLSEQAHKKGAGVEVIQAALHRIKNFVR
jgi:tRNA-dihydrouridine synthase A